MAKSTKSMFNVILVPTMAAMAGIAGCVLYSQALLVSSIKSTCNIHATEDDAKYLNGLKNVLEHNHNVLEAFQNK